MTQFKRPPYSNLNIKEKLQILELRDKNYSYMNIAAIVGRSLSTVKRVVREQREIG